MATGCNKTFESSKQDNEMYYDVEYEDFCKNFEFLNSSTCWICNGYYGPSFNEPLCGTCHAFIFPSVSLEAEEPAVTKYSDDEDSGNDEPEGDQEPRPIDFEDDDEEESFDIVERPPPAPPRNLDQFIELLAEPRPADRQPEKNITALPVEVLLTIFSLLDDISLCAVGEVCRQWKRIVEIHTSQQMWRRYTKERWPLFQQISAVPDWLHMYSALMDACFCRTCLIQMALKIPLARVNNLRNNHLRKDIRGLDLDASEGISATPLDHQSTHWQATILGPPNSPYEGGKFFLYIMIPASYPLTPPQVRFLTRIIHPNVSRHGDIGIDIINHNWSLALGIPKLLLSVQSLLTDPFTQICMEPELGRMYETERPKFEALARSWTWKYAMFEILPPLDLGA